MKTLSFILIVFFFLIGGFSALNWETFNIPTELSIGFATLNMPLGIILLGCIIVITALFLLFIMTMQASTLLMTRRHSKAMQEQQKLADKAELSRFTDLRQFLELEFKQHVTQNVDLNNQVIHKIDALETQLKASDTRL